MFYKLSVKEKLLKGGAWAFAGKFATALIGLFINALLARLLSPEEMGAYFLIFSLVMFAAIFAQLGLTNTIVRLVAESMGTGRPERARYAVILVLKIVALSALLVACFMVFGAGQWIAEKLFNSVLMGQLIGLASVWVVLVSFQHMMAEIFRGFHDIRLAIIFGGLATSVFSMVFFLTLWLVQSKGGLDQILILTLGAGLSSILISSAVLWDKLNKYPLSICNKHPIKTKESKIPLIDILKISWPLWITSIVLFVLVQADIWIMGFFGSSEDVAVYGAASRTVALIAIPQLIVNAVAAPVIAEMHAQGDIQNLEKILRFVALVSTVPSLCVFAVFATFGGELLGMLFGEYYQVGGILLGILGMGQIVNVWVGSCGLVLMLTGHQMTMMFISLGSGFITIALALFLVHDLHGFGVAIASATGMALQNFLMLSFAKKQIGIWTMADFTVLINKEVWKKLIR